MHLVPEAFFTVSYCTVIAVSHLCACIKIADEARTLQVCFKPEHRTDSYKLCRYMYNSAETQQCIVILLQLHHGAHTVYVFCGTLVFDVSVMFFVYCRFEVMNNYPIHEAELYSRESAKKLNGSFNIHFFHFTCMLHNLHS